MNLEQLTKINIKTDEVKEISDACKKLTSQNKLVEATNDLLKEQQEEARRLSEEVIPTRSKFHLTTMRRSKRQIKKKPSDGCVRTTTGI